MRTIPMPRPVLSRNKVTACKTDLGVTAHPPRSTMTNPRLGLVLIASFTNPLTFYATDISVSYTRHSPTGNLRGSYNPGRSHTSLGPGINALGCRDDKLHSSKLVSRLERLLTVADLFPARAAMSSHGLLSSCLSPQVSGHMASLFVAPLRDWPGRSRLF
ncbi:hypothetical protein L226DRAFT_147010 [Lentinus tigrinus ALCF2SS1-7]|uniref:uncharacterized protein n=1 Tax=Lentinus tigrinus ALCF2SS1-7 TaxID=1328758 RepID=UPI001165E749|nr:hypothetical protein L226DRAFT_147010 [Lentinus tigrinus ALCF2SS1-7]